MTGSFLRFKKLNYSTDYIRSIVDSKSFWLEQAGAIDWSAPPKIAYSGDLSKGDVRWFEDGKLNVCVNCVDRHLPKLKDKIAFIWEGNEPDSLRNITYQDLYESVCKFANILKNLGVKKGDRVCLYMPMVPEAIFAMLACARIGAIHTVVFAGFSSDALADRINAASCCCVITAQHFFRGAKGVNCYDAVAQALAKSHCVKSCLIINHDNVMPTAGSGGKQDSRHNAKLYDYFDLINSVEAACEPEVMSATDPLFILYTSGSTGKPKGIVHGSGGYLLYAAFTHAHVFDLKDDDVFWCGADIGWITGHSYVVYGPLFNGATSLIYEGVPNYPDVTRVAKMIARHKVSIYYTAPTLIRALMQSGDTAVKDINLDSLRVLGTVGEPINPEAWSWYDKNMGKKSCPIRDTWWQTETGGMMLVDLSDREKLKPGCAAKPMYGIVPALKSSDGNVLEGKAKGALVIQSPWPGMLQDVFNDHGRFIKAYLSDYPGSYFSGDGCERDDDGDIWITGRMDDVLNISGHRLGTAEVESALVGHNVISEAAVIGIPHAIKGESIMAFVCLMGGVNPGDVDSSDLINWVREKIGAIATLEHCFIVSDLPKTRSGKIMRRLLRKIYQKEELGDVSTLANPDCLDEIKAIIKSL